MDRDDVRVVELGGGACLALEALGGIARHAEVRWKDLESNAAAERDLAGLVDDAHAAAADLPEKLEVAQTLDGRRYGGLRETLAVGLFRDRPPQVLGPADLPWDSQSVHETLAVPMPSADGADRRISVRHFD
jgi:hypothetical protein